MKKIFYNKGSMMVEAIIMISIIVVALLSAMTVAQKSIYIARQSVHQSEAASLLEEGAEATRIIRDNAWSNISNLTLSVDYYLSFSDGTWVLSTTPSKVDIFTRKIVFSSAFRDASQNLVSSGTLDNQTKLVTVNVSWVESGNVISKTLQFYISDIFS